MTDYLWFMIFAIVWVSGLALSFGVILRARVQGKSWTTREGITGLVLTFFLGGFVVFISLNNSMIHARGPESGSTDPVDLIMIVWRILGLVMILISPIVALIASVVFYRGGEDHDR